jgi:hypothetical protein
MPKENLSNNGLDYLRRLRELEGKACPAPASFIAQAAPGPAFAETPDPGLNERRRYARHKCSGSAELHKQGTTVRTWGAFTDISLGGCYVELQATFPPENVMELVLDLNQVRVRTMAVVRVTYPFLGMGLAFTEMAAEDRARLEEMLGTLAETKTAASSPVAPPASGSPDIKLKMPFVADAMSALKALVHHFETQSQLSRDEFIILLEHSQTYSQF